MGRGGGPIGDHPRRCKAKSRVTQERCGRWACKGREYCQFHGGRRALADKSGLPSYYSKHLGKTLKATLTDFLEAPPHEQIQLYEELALARAMATKAVALASPAFETGKDIKPKTVALSIDVMRDAMNHVKDMCLAVSKIEKDFEDKVSLQVVDMFILQILRAIYRVCGDEHKDIAIRIEEEIETTVRLPAEADIETNSSLETDLTPDQEVLAMDRSVCGGDTDTD